MRGTGPLPGYWTVRLRSTNVTTRVPTANGGVGRRGRGARTGAVADLAAVVDAAGTVDPVAIRGREAVELDPPHPASATANATPNAATARKHDVDGEHVAVVIGDIARP